MREYKSAHADKTANTKKEEFVIYAPLTDSYLFFIELNSASWQSKAMVIFEESFEEVVFEKNESKQSFVSCHFCTYSNSS